MKFKNKPNIPHKINDRIVWESRSVAVVGVILIIKGKNIYVLSSKRGPSSPDFIGKMNIVAGYLDWNENGKDAITRECWEETAFNINDFTEKNLFYIEHLSQPWSVDTDPKSNRQNVTLRYGIIFIIADDKKLPILTTEYNEIRGETEDPSWIPIVDINKHDWAFNHDKIIKDYLKYSKIYE